MSELIHPDYFTPSFPRTGCKVVIVIDENHNGVGWSNAAGKAHHQVAIFHPNDKTLLDQRTASDVREAIDLTSAFVANDPFQVVDKFPKSDECDWITPPTNPVRRSLLHPDYDTDNFPRGGCTIEIEVGAIENGQDHLLRFRHPSGQHMVSRHASFAQLRHLLYLSMTNQGGPLGSNQRAAQ